MTLGPGVSQSVPAVGTGEDELNPPQLVLHQEVVQKGCRAGGSSCGVMERLPEGHSVVLGPSPAPAAALCWTGTTSLREEPLAEAQPLTGGTMHAGNRTPRPSPAAVPASAGAGQQQAEGK